MKLPDQISTVVFDVGNTLHHLDHGFIAEVVTRHGWPVSGHEVAVAEYTAKAEVDAQFRARRAGGDQDRRFSYFGTILRTLHVPTAALEGVLAALHAEDTRESLWRVVDQTTLSVMAALRDRGFTLAVVSNADGRVAASLHARQLAQYFTTIVDSHVVGVEKPDARIFHIALEACNAAAAQALHVGDIYEVDVRGARNAGLTPLLLDPLGRYGEVDCHRIAALPELLALLPEAACRSAGPPP